MKVLDRWVTRIALPVGAVLLLAPALTLAVEGATHWSDLPTPTASYTTLSLDSAALALLVIVGAGTPLAWWLARAPTRPLVVELVLSVPLLLPPLVVGLVLEYLIGAQGPALGWTNTFAGLVTAEVYEAAPYYIFVAWSTFTALPERLWETALTLGWPPVVSFFRVALPLSAPGLAAGAAMAWSRAIGAFGAPIIVSYHPTALPVGLWITLEEYGLPAALPLALVLVLVALPIPLFVVGWARRVAR